MPLPRVRRHVLQRRCARRLAHIVQQRGVAPPYALPLLPLRPAPGAPVGAALAPARQALFANLNRMSEFKIVFCRNRGNSCIFDTPAGGVKKALLPYVFAWFHGRACIFDTPGGGVKKTLFPLLKSLIESAEPINPAAPVTNTFIYSPTFFGNKFS